MELKKRLKTIIGSIAIGVLGLTVAVSADSEHEIEQVSVNMPDVTAYYRSTPQEQQPTAYLESDELTLTSNSVFSESGEGVEYYVLLDVSASIRKNRFEDIKTSLSNFVQSIREQDRMVLMTFGNQTEVKLDGNQSSEDAQGVISQLVNQDQNTVFFDAISNVTDMINRADAQSQMRRVVVIISDGKDCSDNTRNMDNVEKDLMANGIPVYSVAVENNEGDSKDTISNYQGKFSALARNTGGLPWTAQSEQTSVYEALGNIQQSILSSYRAVFQAATNEVSNKTEEFVLYFNDSANNKDTYSVMISRGQADNTAPTVTVKTGTQANELEVTYSEAVRNAETSGNYVLKKDDKVIPLNQVVMNKETANSYQLIFDQELYNGEYSLEIDNITDCSNEKNALENQNQTLEITENEDEPKESILDKILKWWPIPLTVVVIIFIVVVIRQYRKKKGLTIINGEVINEEDIKDHIRVISEKPDNGPKTNLVIWMSNGASEPKKLNFRLDGSAIVGRLEQCDICCDDPMMSRQHFVLEMEGNNLYVTDLETRNGTRVNGVVIRGKYKLERYDEIVAGNIKFRIEW